MANKKPKPAAKPYEPTQRELEAVEANFDRRKRQKPAPRIKTTEKKGAVLIDTDCPDPAIGPVLLMEALGTSELDFLNGLIKQLVTVGTQGPGADESGPNFLLAAIRGIEPKDQVEAMLATQMAVTHSLAMECLGRARRADQIPQVDSAGNLAVKLLRTYTMQLEALAKLRRGGEQKVRVDHVHVYHGGQAMVGTVEVPALGGPLKSKDEPHALSHASGASIEAEQSVAFVDESCDGSRVRLHKGSSQ